MLAANTDYKLGLYENQGNQLNQQKIVAVLTETGLGKAQKAMGSKILLRFEAKVNGSGVIPNQAQTYTNGGSGEPFTEPNTPPGTPPPPPPSIPPIDTPKVYSAWGKIKVIKHDEASKQTLLGGAKFKLYKCTDATFENLQDGPITVNNKSEWETSGTGEFTIDGIHVTNFANNADVRQPPSYCLVETQAPQGYELLAQPIKFDLTIGGKDQLNGPQLADAVQTLNLTKEVPNVKFTPKLPLTGGMGVLVFGLSGAAIIGFGTFFMRRRAAEKE
ncbi:SpaH/EbpB family LPXTG-anchored major pilin [Arcanobacterium hippocoleae]